MSAELTDHSSLNGNGVVDYLVHCGLKPPTSNVLNKKSYSVQNLIWIEFDSFAPNSISHNSIIIFKRKKLLHIALV